MRILKRRTNHAPLHDEYLSYLTVAEAREFRRVVEASFARAGHDVTVHVDHVEDRRGTTFGLWNIAAFCRGADPSEWAGLIDEHVQRVTTPPVGLGELAPEEAEAALYLRLVEAGSVADAGRLAYARPVAPGLLEVLAVDLPDSVEPLPREALPALGTLHDLLERGRENLRALLSGEDVTAQTITGPAGPLTLVTSPSYFTASLALVLPDTVERFTGEVDRGDGVLVAVPDRHELLYLVIDDVRAADALEEMFGMSRWAFEQASGPLSPNVFWVHARSWEQVTTLDGGKPAVSLREELERVDGRSAWSTASRPASGESPVERIAAALDE